MSLLPSRFVDFFDHTRGQSEVNHTCDVLAIGGPKGPPPRRLQRGAFRPVRRPPWVPWSTSARPEQVQAIRAWYRGRHRGSVRDGRGERLGGDRNDLLGTVRTVVPSSGNEAAVHVGLTRLVVASGLSVWLRSPP